MTKLSLLIYAADVLDGISNVCITFGVFAAIAFVIFSCIALVDDEDDVIVIWCRAHTKRTLIITVIAMFFFFGASVIIPEKKTMYTIVGIEMADMFSQTDTAKELSNEMKSVLTDITGIIHSYAHETGANTQKEAE